MDASHDQMDRVGRARLVESCGSRDDSPSWNLGRVQQDDTIRVDGMGPQGRRQARVPKAGGSERSRVKVKSFSGTLS